MLKKDYKALATNCLCTATVLSDQTFASLAKSQLLTVRSAEPKAKLSANPIWQNQHAGATHLRVSEL